MIGTLLGCAGLVFILRYGSILEGPRVWLARRSSFFADLLGCTLCLGFWVGSLPLLEGALRSGDIDPWWMPRTAAFCWVADLGIDVLDQAIAALRRTGRQP